MVIDAVMYSGEREALAIRLHELAGVVDLHVIVEAAETFTGLPKPLTFARDDALGCFSEHRARILYCVATLPPGGPWEREAYQRNACTRMLDGLPDDAVVLIGDVDEVPAAEAVRDAAVMVEDFGQVGIDMTLSLYYANNICTTSRWRGTQAVSMQHLRNVTPQAVRDMRNAAIFIPHAGWHFGSLLGDEGAPRFERKLRSFSHAAEVAHVADPAHVAEAIAEGRDVSGRQDILFRADLEPRADDYPAWLWQHRQEWAHLFAPGTAL